MVCVLCCAVVRCVCCVVWYGVVRCGGGGQIALRHRLALPFSPMEGTHLQLLLRLGLIAVAQDGHVIFALGEVQYVLRPHSAGQGQGGSTSRWGGGEHGTRVGARAQQVDGLPDEDLTT